MTSSEEKERVSSHSREDFAVEGSSDELRNFRKVTETGAKVSHEHDERRELLRSCSPPSLDSTTIMKFDPPFFVTTSPKHQRF